MTTSAFVRRRAVASIVSVGALAAFSLAGASSASAATDCSTAPNLDGATSTVADIQLLLDADTPVICLSGTFAFATPLTYDYDLTLHGLTNAVLDGNDVSGVLERAGSSTLVLENLRVTRGSSSGGSTVDADTLVVRNSTFDHNNSAYGGAIFANDADVEGSTFTDNTAAFGGAAFIYGPGSISDSTFSRNTANTAGGAIMAYGLLAVDESTFDSNVGGYVAGAAYAADGADIANSTFSQNSAAKGGALFVYDGGSIGQTTFRGNTSGDHEGDAVWSNDPMTLHGSIFSGSAGPYLYTSDFTDLDGNLFTTAAEPFVPAPSPSTQFGVTDSGIFGSNVLANNGGLTQTIAISPSGPAIDAVPGAASGVDQRGVARTGFSDAGSFEYVAPAAVVPAPALAATGVESGWLAALAAGLLGLGAVGVIARRRRA